MITLCYLKVWSHSQILWRKKKAIGNSVAMSVAPLNPTIICVTSLNPMKHLCEEIFLLPEKFSVDTHWKDWILSVKMVNVTTSLQIKQLL